MFKSKAKVDQQASLILSKVRDDDEKRLRGYQLGNLYFEAKEYEQAKKYVSLFLAVRDQYAPAHKLMGQIWERSPSPDAIKKSISHYKRSFDLDDSQKQLTLKICSLYLRMDIPAEHTSGAMYWIERSKAFYPNEPVIFSLQEKLINQSLNAAASDDAEGDYLTNAAAMEDLLVSNLKARPTDINVRMKLLKCLEKSQNFDSALACIREAMETAPYTDSFDWYNYTANLLKFVTKDSDEVGWFLYLLNNFGAARTAVKGRPEKVATDTLQRLDQALHSSLDQPGNLLTCLRDELRSHQLLLAANLLSRRNADQASISALYVAAFSQPADSADSARGRDDGQSEMYDLVNKLRAHRLTQTGYIVLSRAPAADQLNWLRKLSQKFYNNDGKRKLYSVMFGTAAIDSSKLSSLFMQELSVDQLQPVLPSNDELMKLCALAQALYPDSLHHQTWLALRPRVDDSLPNYLLGLIPRLSFSPHSVGQRESESVSQLDMAIFLLLTVYATRSRLREHRDDAPKVADLSVNLCTEEQAQWWSAVYESCGHSALSTSVTKFSKQRQLISRGLQVIRLLDSHSLSVQMVCHIARILQSKLEEAKLQHSSTSSRVIHLTHWIKQYWTEGVRMLGALYSNQALQRLGWDRLFLSYEEELKPEELGELLCEGRLWLALQLYEEDREDEALQELRELPQALASYTAAQIYKARADVCADTSSDSRERLLTLTQESLHLTVDRLASDRTNPLNAAVDQKLERVESELNGQSFINANESITESVNGNGSLVSTPKPVLARGPTATAGHRLLHTPRSASSLSIADLSSSVRVRPSPERLELQVRSLATAQETLRSTIYEDRAVAVETSKQMVDTVAQLLDSRLSEVLDSTRKLSEDVRSMQRDINDSTHSQHEIKRDIADLKTAIALIPTSTAQPSSSDTQVQFLQQQLTALTAMMATSLQHPALHPAAASLSGYGTPARGTPPVYQAGHSDVMQMGTYPHIPPQQPTPSRLSATGGKASSGLTQQEMHAAALAAAEHGYDDREYYVDDGENYYGEEYPYGEDYTNESYVGAEGVNTIAYMPKLSVSGKPMPQPGFFAQTDKSQTKLADPKPSEPGVPPNVVFNKEMMDKEADKQRAAEPSQSPLVVNVPRPGAVTAVSTPPVAAYSSAAPSATAVPPSPAKSDTGSHNDSSHDRHFEPVIELPPEVAVVTGEEDETARFEGRAKLFRLVDKEWKERGVGPVKILERKDGRCRLVMRRDQVHKICANHGIQQAMSLAAMGDKGIAWTWAATDYTEHEPTKESFAIRFKSQEIAADFKEAFDLAKEKSSGAVATSGGSAAAPTQATQDDKKPSDSKQNSLADLFKTSSPQWKCSGCLLSHDVSITLCPSCGTAQPGAVEVKPAPPTAAPSTGFSGFAGFTIPSQTTSSFIPATVSGAAPVSASSIFAAGGIFGGLARPSTAVDAAIATPSESSSSSATTSGTATPTEETVGEHAASATAAPITSLFGTKALNAGSAQPTGLFGNITRPAAVAVSKESARGSEEGSSLLKQLLTADTTPAKDVSGKFSMGGFTFNAPPKMDAKPETKSAAELATSKPALFAGFTGFSQPAATSTPSTGFTFGTPGASSSPFTFTPPAASRAFSTVANPSLTAPKPDMKQSSSAPQLASDRPTDLVTEPNSKDDSNLMSPSKLNPEDECRAEFTPVIALPDLIEVSTGEENEGKTFGERSKLYRLDDGQWKERGLGELKILRHNICGTHRLIMRREQVLKLCANHKLIFGMKLAPSGEKAWIWNAQDFSESEVKKETLCAKFRSAEIAQAFEKAFNAAVAEDNDRGNEELTAGKETEAKPAPPGQPTTSAATPPSGGGSLSELFKPKEGEWACTMCAVKNKADTSKCACCQTGKPGSVVTPGFSTQAAAPGPSVPFTLASSSSLTKPAAKPDIPKVMDFSKLAFGSPKLPVIGSTEASTSFPSSRKDSVPESPGKYVMEESEGDHIHFEPVIDLPDLVDVKTGEEDEKVLYVHRAKLYRFTDGEYKERGLGDVKLLEHKTTGKVRLILRREKVLKLVCNHLLTPDITLRPMESATGKAWVWYAADFSEGKQADEMFAIRFKTAEIANEFKACFDAAKTGEIIPEQTLKTVSETPTRARSRPPSESQSRSRPPSESHSATSTPVQALPNKAQTGAVFGSSADPKSVFGGTGCQPHSATSDSTKPAAKTLFGNVAAPKNIFGGSAATQSPAANLFGAASATQSPAANLFGAASTTQSPAANLFGGSSTTQSPAANLFGGASTSHSPAANVFGGASATQSPAANLFGAASATQSPAANLFGAASATQSPAANLFGGASTNQTPAASVFGGSAVLNKSKIPVLRGKALPSTPQSAIGPSKSVFGVKSDTTLSITSTSSNASATPGTVFGAPGTVFGAKPSSQALFGGAGAMSPSVFGGARVPPIAPDGDVEFICETKPSEELMKKAREFLLPSGYYLYEDRKDCKGCIGCPANEDAILDHLFFNKPYTKNKGLSPLPKGPAAKSTPEVTASSGFATYSDATDFSSLSAASSGGNAFQKTEGFKWSGAGKTLFGGNSSTNAQEDNPEAFEAESEFKPVLEVLPDLVETRTGEEDEERIFCHRAKLFRFDNASSQWKERGIGEMKLLKHEQNGTVRILLRREQVHKLVCNHLVQPEIELKPLATSETAWCWFAKDYSDTYSEDAVEQFAVRFKTVELAKQFKEKFEECKEFVIEAQKSRSTTGAAGQAGASDAGTPSGDDVQTLGARSNAEAGDYDDEDDDDDDDEIKVHYERQVTLLELQGSQYQPIGIRTLQVVEENIDIIGGIAVYVTVGDNLEYRQLIFLETAPATVAKNFCSWQMYDFLTERPHLKHFQAKFASSAAAKEFSKHILDGIDYAKEMQLREAETIHSSMATNPIELDLSSAVVSPK